MTPSQKAAMEQALAALRHGIKEMNKLNAAVECMPLHEAARALSGALAEESTGVETREVEALIQATRCECGDRPIDQCPEPWEPGCDLGNNEAHVKVSTQSVEQTEPVVWECKAGGLKKLTQSQYDKQRDVVKQYYSRIETPAVSATTDEDRNRFEAAWNQHRGYLGSDVGVSAKDIAWAVWQAGVATSPTPGCEQASPAYLAEPGAAQATRVDLVANWPQHNRANMTVKLYCTPPTTKDKHDT